MSYSQSRHGSCSCPGGQLSVSAALESVGAAAADGRTSKSPAGARIQDTGQRDKEPDRPGSHVWHRTTHYGINEIKATTLLKVEHKNYSGKPHVPGQSWITLRSFFPHVRFQWVSGSSAAFRCCSNYENAARLGDPAKWNGLKFSLTAELKRCDVLVGGEQRSFICWWWGEVLHV